MSIANPYAPPSVPTKRRKSGPMPDWISAPLRSTRPWVILFAVLGFLGALSMLLYIVLLVMLGLNSGNIGAAVIGAVIGLAGFFCYFLPSYLLMKFGSAIGRCVDGEDLNQLQGVLEAQASFWKTSGILVVLMFVLSIVAGVVLSLLGLALPGLIEPPQPIGVADWTAHAFLS
jgi:hypothetical protein